MNSAFSFYWRFVAKFSITPSLSYWKYTIQSNRNSSSYTSANKLLAIIALSSLLLLWVKNWPIWVYSNVPDNFRSQLSGACPMHVLPNNFRLQLSGACPMHALLNNKTLRLLGKHALLSYYLWKCCPYPALTLTN